MIIILYNVYLEVFFFLFVDKFNFLTHFFKLQNIFHLFYEY